MPDEIDPEQERAEKQRLLSELAQKGPFKKTALPRSTEIEDPAALADLYRQSVGLPDETTEEPLTPDAAPRSISKITHYEIKAMKVKASTQEETSAKRQTQFANFFIRTWFGLTASFKPKADKRTRCQLHGHECAHCGAKFHKIAE